MAGEKFCIAEGHYYNEMYRMSRKTIAKISGFVICFACVCANFAGCSQASSRSNPETEIRSYQKPKSVGRFENREITESSGIAASLCQSEVYWTHNDSGDGPFIFAADRKGKDLGTWRVTGARNADWEDIAAGKDAIGRCFLYIGEIGNNELERAEGIIYRIPEPNISVPTNGRAVSDTEPASLLRFRYPDKRHNAETLLSDPKTGSIYVLTKRFDGPAGIYRLQPDFGAPVAAVAEKVGEIAVPSVPNGLLTGGSISPDGNRVILCDYTAGYELVLPQAAATFDEIWKQKPAVIDLGERKQGEAVTYTTDGRSIIATSEGKNAVLYQVDRVQ